VYCCEVLHHNDASGLRRTFAEIFRVLRPGGRLLMVNETLKTLRDPDGVDIDGVAQFDGYEHAHWALQYRWEATRAGFLTEVTEPHYKPFFGDAELPARGEEVGRAGELGHRAAESLRRHGIPRRAYLTWLNHVAGGVSMNMIATKPRHYVGRHEGIGALERGARTLAAGARTQIARLRGRSPARLPRTPEQATNAQLRAQSR
jgi:SAM-dependent methyltransferase